MLLAVNGGSYFVTQKDDFHKNLEFSFVKIIIHMELANNLKLKNILKKIT